MRKKLFLNRRKRKLDRHIEVIGIDHGWSGTKTVSQVFTTGVKEITTEPAFFNNVVEYNGSYYKVGGRRLEVRDLKVENDNFYLLTLAAVAKELNRRGMRNAKVLLSVGLPLTRFGAENRRAECGDRNADGFRGFGRYF